jgi:DNA-binding transcriptional LysR family regulator
VDLRQLRCFAVLAEELNFGRAARRLDVAQPAVSQQIARLEADLEVSLFDRDRNSVHLTEAGNALFTDARRILDLVDAATVNVRTVGRAGDGLLRIGFLGSLHAPFPAAIERIRRENPRMHVQCIEQTYDQLISGIREDRIHIGVYRQWLLTSPLPTREVGRTRLMIALHDAHPLADQPRVQLADLARDPFVFFSQTIFPGYSERVGSLCRTVGFTPYVAQEVFSVPAAMYFVGAKAGVSVQPEFHSVESKSRVVFRELEPTVYLPTAAIWRPNSTHKPLLLFQEILAELGQPATAGG